MKLSLREQSNKGFTLAEVLAALAFMAIVIPVAVEGVRIANLAGQVAARKAVAAQIGERILTELSLQSSTQGNLQRGTVREGALEYEWQLQSEPWSQEAMQLVTIHVTFPVQGKSYDVRLSTLWSNTAL